MAACSGFPTTQGSQLTEGGSQPDNDTTQGTEGGSQPDQCFQPILRSPVNGTPWFHNFNRFYFRVMRGDMYDLKCVEHPLKDAFRHGPEFKWDLFDNLRGQYGPKGYTPLNLFQGSLGRCRRRLINTTSTHKGRRMGPAYMVKLDFRQAALKSVLLPHDIIDLTTKESMIAYWGDFLENEELAKLKPPGIGFCWKGFRDLWRFMSLIYDDGTVGGCLNDYIDLDDNGDPVWRGQADAEPTRPHGSQSDPASSEQVAETTSPSSEQVAAPPNVAAAATDLPDKLASLTLQLSGARSPVMSNDQSPQASKAIDEDNGAPSLVSNDQSHQESKGNDEDNLAPSQVSDDQSHQESEWKDVVDGFNIVTSTNSVIPALR